MAAQFALASGVCAQSVAESDKAVAVEEIVVVGSQIKGSKVTAALPVSVLDVEAIQATGAVSGNELLRNLPQAGGVTFNATSNPTSSNSARGDANSINLRNLGPGNTLVLLNGRRTVVHPTTQTTGTTPAFTYNSNAIPVSGIKSLEVLRDGAAAIYGTDAVAGVINTTLMSNYDGVQVEAQYGFAEDTSMREGRLTGLFGKSWADGRGNITVFATHERRSALLSSDSDYTALADRRLIWAGTEFANATSLDVRDTRSAWGQFQTTANVGTIRSNGVAVTGSTGIFHVAPQTNPTCGVLIGAGICIDAGALNATNDRNLRLDPRSFKITQIPETNRTNIFAVGNYDIADDVTAYSEAGFYRAMSYGAVDSSAVATTTLTVTVPANSYYNPFGPVLLANGQLNSNRLPGLSANVPAAGLPVTVVSYNTVDAGQQRYKVKNSQYRVLGGLKGNRWGFNWDSALLYTSAEAVDTFNSLSATLLQAALARTDPTAYNPFNGGTVANPGYGDATPSNAATLNSLKRDFTRKSTTSLALWDFKINRPDLVAIWAGDIGLAAGVEVRRETYHDDRDSRIDGSTPYVDIVTGQSFNTDVPNTSPAPDVKGSRVVRSAFAELAVPVVSPEMSIPGVRRLEFQLAGRVEDYSDVGAVAKPKVAGAWDLLDGVRLRGSWSKGFQAPNLEVINTAQILRNANQTDFIFCEADLRARRIASFNACSQAPRVRTARSGNPDLKPETSENLSYGLVLEPKFLPSAYGRFIGTVDVWRIEQNGIIGSLGSNNALLLDYLFRLQGKSNPLVRRLAPTPEETALFAGTGLTPVGQVDIVEEKFQNLNPQIAKGIDVGLSYRLKTEGLGDFSANVDVSKLLKFSLLPTVEVQTLLDARASGAINAASPVTGGGDLINLNGNIEWRGSGGVHWTNGTFGVSYFAQYIGSYRSTGLSYADGSFYKVPATTFHNLSASYSFDDSRWERYGLKGTRLLIGARNILDKEPPSVPVAAPAIVSYDNTQYNPYARYWYFNIRKTF